MEFDLRYLNAHSDIIIDENRMVDEIISQIKTLTHATNNGKRFYNLPTQEVNLPRSKNEEKKSAWREFAKTKNIKQRKTMFCKKTKKYLKIKDNDDKLRTGTVKKEKR